MFFKSSGNDIPNARASFKSVLMLGLLFSPLSISLITVRETPDFSANLTWLHRKAMRAKRIRSPKPSAKSLTRLSELVTY